MKSVSSLTRIALLFALCIILNFLESTYVLFPLYPGVKLGLSNVAVMYALFLMNFRVALSLSVAKALFSFITRGFSAGVLSLAGGFVSILAMLVLYKVFKDKISLLTLSVTGGVLHNLAQLTSVSLMWQTSAVFSLSPILIISGTVFGILNALLLRTTLPYLKRLGGAK